MRIAVPQALCVLWEHTRPRPKSGKVCCSDTRPGDVCERAERTEGSDTTPSETPRVSPCVPLCAIFFRKPSVYPAFVCENERGAFVPEVLKTVWTMCWKRWYDCVSCAFRAFFEDEKESKIKRGGRKATPLALKAPQCGAFRGLETAV